MLGRFGTLLGISGEHVWAQLTLTQSKVAPRNDRNISKNAFLEYEHFFFKKTVLENMVSKKYKFLKIQFLKIWFLKI